MSIAPSRSWSVESFRAFWANPDPKLVAGVRGILTDDIVGYWPRPIGIVRGPAAYTAVIDAVVNSGVRFSLRIGEHASTGDFTFIRWIATTNDGEFSGCDRLRTRDGKVCENYVFCDHPFFERVAERLRVRAAAWDS